MRRKLIAFVTLLVVLFVQPAVAWAHPIDEYLQATYVTLEPSRVTVELDLTPGVLVAPGVMTLIDADGDGAFSQAEGQAYAQRVLGDVTAELDGTRLPLRVTDVQMPEPLVMQAGGGEVRLTLMADVNMGASLTHTLVVRNAHAPVKSAHQATLLMPKSSALTINGQTHEAAGGELRVDYALGAGASPSSSSITTAQPADNVSAQQNQLFDVLRQATLTPAAVALAFGLAIVLGGLHALTPGHGKTLVAAYLVGSRGTVRHAVLLGSVTTFTHTISVIVVGLLALAARQFIMPGLLVPILEIGSGVLVVVMGVQLVLTRWRALRTGDAAHDHGFGPHIHALGDRTHQPISRGGILAMGVSGGLIPCPEALGIMLLAVGLNRAGFGLGLVVAFSLGLAAVLIGIGVVLVRSKALIERFGGIGTRWQHPLEQVSRWLPLAGAVVVTALGIVLVVKGVMLQS